MFRRRLRFLLDTRVLLWALTDVSSLPIFYRSALRSKYNEIFFSAASIWDLATSEQPNRWARGFAPDEIARSAIETGFIELPISADAAAKAGALPAYHEDPIDRILIAQAMIQPARFLTTDRFLANYSDIVEIIQEETHPQYQRYGAFSGTARSSA
jgi:PIN domain nuclease of toxin-antitoxin system